MLQTRATRKAAWRWIELGIEAMRHKRRQAALSREQKFAEKKNCGPAASLSHL
jgi:hypothetical protein